VPFEAENAIGVVLKHITDEPPKPSSLVPNVDPRLEAVCVRALRKRLDDRYQTAREMRSDLRLMMEGRTLQQSVPELPSVRVRVAEAATGNAATVQMLQTPHFARADEPAPKPTLVGTAVPIPRRTGRITTVAIGATLTGAVVAAITLVLLARPKAVTSGTHPPAADISAAPDTTVASMAATDNQGDVPPLEPSEPGSAGSASRHPGLHGSHSAAPLNPKLLPSAVPAVSAVVAPAAIAPAPATSATVATVATVATTVTDPDPSFDPSRAFVEVGLINAQGVREGAIRGALHNVPLAGCYRSALKTRGARVAGVATLNLSIDENGAARSAIITGAGFLPGLARCIQGAASGAGVSKSQVDPGGGTAEITLAFKAP
jgi:serine/threonine-protein kinase